MQNAIGNGGVYCPTVNSMENGFGKLSSNPIRDSLHSLCTNALGKGMNLFLLHSAIG